jgi:hypothetical protein
VAVTFTYGTVGSGKTYSLVRECVDRLQKGETVATINLFLKRERVREVLRSRGMSPWDTGQACERIEPVWTSARFRELRGVFLAVDEAHFWWPQSQYRKIDLEDILTAAMSRKRKVDLHVISQLDKSVNQNVRDLALESWLARPMLIEPFVSGLKIMSRIGRGMGWPALDRPCAFFYERMTSAMGSTERRRDRTLGDDDKKLIFLNPAIAACYDTLQEVSSPVLDEMRDQSQQAYLLSVAKGETRPQLACPVCGGRRTWRFVEYPLEVDGRVIMQREPFDADVLTHNQWARYGEADCAACDDGTGPRGYVYAEDHPDYERAASVMEHIGRMSGRARRAAGS